ncbi:perlucin-like protein [Drosophila eugracilis]|uniref:perlucin-like protein n=1 Tax=Drosophila eugracilis TaxID=29029 RepID=UPI0007E6C842|nr:perlucin-like protein [Drosophila eugracilis]
MVKTVLFILAFLAFVVGLRALICPSQYTQVGEKCLYVSRNKVNWNAAARQCRKLGGSLLVFDNEVEVIITTAHLLNVGVSFNDSWRSSVWVGIDALENDHKFILSKTGDAIFYPYWAKNQPSSNKNEKCGGFANYGSWGYFNNACSYSALFVCEARGYYP